MGFDPVQAYNLLLERIDQLMKIMNALVDQVERIVEALEQMNKDK